ncbi:MAG: M28 family peptidase [Bacteroidales bacterium]|nr:M28 family peptidase [Bacteroidales bacterium]
MIFILVMVPYVCSDAQTGKDVKMVPSGKNAEKIVTDESLIKQIEYLSDTTFGGRATGERGAAEAAFWISRRVKDAGLMPFAGVWSQSFKVGDKTGHNIIGFLPGSRNTQKETYVLVTAHYDSYGKMDGKTLPAADSNASGVVAMCEIARMFNYMKELGRSYGSNIIFLATDAKEKGSAGATAFTEAVKAGELLDPLNQKVIELRQIKSTVVLDILGASLEPVHKGRKDYLIMLSSAGDRYDLQSVNDRPELSLDLGFDYYGSKNFTDIYHHRIGDQKIYTECGMPCTLFTSGITMKTNKVADDFESLNYEVFRKRIIVIFHWLTKIL